MDDGVRLSPGGGVELHDLLRDPATDRPSLEGEIDVPPGQEETLAPGRARERELPQPSRDQVFLRDEDAAPAHEGPEQGHVGRGDRHHMARPFRAELIDRLAQEAAQFEIPREGQGDQGR
jgi:hypothetical protein